MRRWRQQQQQQKDEGSGMRRKQKRQDFGREDVWLLPHGEAMVVVS